MMEQITARRGRISCLYNYEVKQNGAYVSINGYDNINGFIFIGEIASGWVKNIRGFVRDGQRVVCKVWRGKKDQDTYELSLRVF